MVVIGHLAIGAHPTVETVGDAREHIQKRLAIFVFFVDHLLAIAAGGDVVKRAGEFEA